MFLLQEIRNFSEIKKKNFNKKLIKKFKDIQLPIDYKKENLSYNQK